MVRKAREMTGNLKFVASDDDRWTERVDEVTFVDDGCDRLVAESHRCSCRMRGPRWFN